MGEDVRDPDHQWNGDKADQRQLQIENKHGDDDADKREDAANDLSKALAQELVDGLNIVDQARHKISGLILVEIRDRQDLDFIKDLRAQLGEEALPYCPNEIGLARLRGKANDVYGQQKQHFLCQARRVLTSNKRIDGHADEGGTGCLRRGRDNDQGKRADELDAKRGKITQKSAQDCAGIDTFGGCIICSGCCRAAPARS